MDVVIDNNGSIYSAYVFAVKQEGSNGADIEGLMEAAENTARDKGFKTQPHSHDGYKGFKASKRFENVDLNSRGLKFLGFDSLPSVFKKADWNYTPGMFEERYSAELIIDLRNIFDPELLKELPGDMIKDIYETVIKSELIFNLTIPGDVVSTNADNISEGRNDTRYTWKISPGQTRTLSAESVLKKKATRNIAYIIASVSAVLLLTVLIAAAIINISRKRY